MAITPQLSSTNQRSAQAATVALSFVRRVLIEGAPATRETLAREASFLLGRPADDALRELDAVGQRLGVSSLL